MLKNPSHDSLPQCSGVEIDKKPFPDREQFHICKQLRLMNTGNVLNGFQFHNNFVVHD